MIATQWLEATQDTLVAIFVVCICGSFWMLIDEIDNHKSKLPSGIMLVASLVALFFAVAVK